LSEVYDFFIFYSQLIVTDEAIAPVPNDWTERHVAQGFTWDPGTVSFGTLGDVGDLRVEVQVAGDPEARPDAARAIVVPFSVSPPGHVTLSDCVNEETVGVPAGEYALLFEIGRLNEERVKEAEWCRLSFVPGGDVQPEILRADAELSPQYPLLMESDLVWQPS
jgi:hypothetical protein